MPGTRRPPSHTALAALPAIALDLETTGLDVAEGRIVQIGAVAMRGPVVLSEPRIDTCVAAGIPPCRGDQNSRDCRRRCRGCSAPARVARAARGRRVSERPDRGAEAVAVRSACAGPRSARARRYPQGAAFFDRRTRSREGRIRIPPCGGRLAVQSRRPIPATSSSRSAMPASRGAASEFLDSTGAPGESRERVARP